MNALTLSTTLQIVNSSSAAPCHASKEYIDHTHGHAPTEYLELGPTSSEELAPGNCDHTPLLSMDVFTDDTGEPIMVGNDVEVSCEDEDVDDIIAEAAESKETN
jgi:hypothetical protein